MASKKQKQAGFLLPETINPNQVVCVRFDIPDTVEYRNAVRGHIYELAKWWLWERSGLPGDTRARDAAELFRVLIESTLSFGGCEGMPFELRQNPANPCLLEQSLDGGLNWSLAFDYNLCKSSIEDYVVAEQNKAAQNEKRQQDYDGTPGSINPDAPTTWTGGTGGVDALCSAVKAYVDGQVLDTLNKYRIAAGLAAIGAGLLGMGGILFAIVGGAVAFVIGLALSDVEEAASDRAALDAVICNLKSALGTGTVTESAFQSAINGLTGANHNQDTIIEILKGNMASQVNYLWFIDLLGAAQQPVAAGALVDCPCDNVWCYWFDFEHFGLDGWQAWPETGYSTVNYSAGIGILHSDVVDTRGNPDTGNRTVNVKRPFTSATITRIEVTYTITKGAYASGANPTYWLFVGGAQVASVTYAAETNGTKTRIWTGAISASEMALAIRSSYDSSAPYSYSGSIVVKSVKVSGTGQNPFGLDNCPPPP